MNVLSLFDGLSCGMIALERAGIEVNNYYSSEIDKYAIKVSEKNYPNIIRLGDITQWHSWDIDWPSIDLILAGSPCQGFSFAGKQLAFDDPRSRLFFTFVDILNHVKSKNPKTKFLLENVRMKKEFREVITNFVGVEPVEINSALVSAQNRKRLYWTNIGKIEQPEDKKTMLSDIIDFGFVDREKSYCLDANYFKGTNLVQYLTKCRRQVVFNYSSSGRGNGKVEHRFYESLKGKAHTMTKTGYTRRAFTGVIDDMVIRKLTPIECERLQTIPDNYTDAVSNTQRYKMLGNGWNVDTIVHILKGLK